MAECGIDVNSELGFCRLHLAELWGVSKNRIEGMIQAGKLEPFPAEEILCGVGKRGNQLIPMGQILDFDSSGSRLPERILE